MTEGGIPRLVQHPLSPFKKRAIFAIAILGLVMAIGTIGMNDLGRLGPGDLVLFHVPSGNGRRHGTSIHDCWGQDLRVFHGLSLYRRSNICDYVYLRTFVWLYIQRGLRLCRERRGQTEHKTRAQGPCPFICRLGGDRTRQSSSVTSVISSFKSGIWTRQSIYTAKR